MPDRYDPLMTLGDAKNTGVPDATLKSPGDSARYPAGTDQFNGAANLGTTTVEKMPLMTYGTPADNGLRLPEGADNYNGVALNPAPRQTHRPIMSYDKRQGGDT